MRAFGVDETQMRAKKFIGGAHKEIAIQRLNVRQKMRGVMHGVNIGQRADAFGGLIIRSGWLNEPHTLDAKPNATNFVLGEIMRSN